MKRKILTSLAIVSVVGIVIMATLTTLVFYNNTVEQMQRTAYQEVQYFKSSYELSEQDSLTEIQELSKINPNTRVTLIAPDGTVLFDSHSNAAEMENHADRPEVIQALEGKTGFDTRTSDTIEEQNIYYAAQLQDGNVLRVALTTTVVGASITATIPWLLVVLLVTFLLSLYLSGVLTERIVKPINDINLKEPEKNEIYPELAPLLGRIIAQNREIQSTVETLKVKQNEFTAITEHMSEGFLVVSNKAEVLSFNSTAAKLLGLTAQDEQMMHPNVLLFNRSNAFRIAVDTALEGLPFEQDVVLNGQHYRLIANPVKQGEQVTGAVLVMLDTTERESRERMRREFSANVSHELKTPLTSISGYAEIIKNGMVKSEDVPRFAERIYDEAGRLITLVGDILKLSQLDEDAVEMEEESVNLYNLAEEVVARLEEAAKANQVTIAVRGEKAQIRGMRQILDEMIFNLCDNAIRYNRAGGSVTVTVERRLEHVVLTVADTGIGIPQSDQERVFERFYRVDKSHSKEVGGTGLGLSIVKHSAQYHHASVSLESTEGVGTTITIVF